MDNNMDNKKADDKVLDEVIVEKRRKEIEQIADTRDSFIRISKNIEKCIDLLNSSIRTSKNNKDLDDLRRDNARNLAKTLEHLDEKKLEVEKKYKNYKEKEEE